MFSYRGIIITALLLLSAVVWGAAGMAHSRLLVVNPTDSLPRGIYVRTWEPVRLGTIVHIPLPAVLQPLTSPGSIASQGLLKPVVALDGDIICREGAVFSVNGRELGTALPTTKEGQPLPSWAGCHQLVAGEIAVWTDRLVDALDSRYFGSVPAATALVYRPLQTR